MSSSRQRLVAIAWTLLIVAACSIPGTDLPEVDIEFADKAAHFAIFAVLAWLWLRALRTPIRLRYLVVILAGSLFGGLTEIYQGMLPWERTPDIYDAIANAFGLLAGSGFYAACSRARTVRESNH